MCISKPEKIIAVTGKSSEIISTVLVRALKACNSEESINVAWGGINEIIDASGDVDISLLVALDFDEEITSEFSQNIKEIVAPYSEACVYKKMAPEDCTVLQYAVEENMADIVAKNVIRTDDYTSFELLAVGRIGRLKFNEEKDTTVQNMLAAAGVMLAAGIDFDSVIMSLNNMA